MIRTKTRIAIAGAAYQGVNLLRGPWRSKEVTVRRRAITWQLDLRQGIDLSIYLFGSFEPSVVKAYGRVVHPGSTVVDVGANIGAHTLPLARAVGAAGRVYAFEPTSFAFGKMEANVALNPMLAARVVPERAMLVKSDADALPGHVYSSWPVTGHLDLHPQHRGQLMGTENAEAVTLDRYVERAGVNAVDFVKIDVDGNEDHVLLGATATVSRFRPVMIVELAPYLYDGSEHSFEVLIDFLADHGYSMSELKSGDALPLRPDALRDRIPEGGSVNALCRPGG